MVFPSGARMFVRRCVTTPSFELMISFTFSLMRRTALWVCPAFPVTGISRPSNSVVYHQRVVSPRALTDSMVTFIPVAPDAS